MKNIIIYLFTFLLTATSYAQIQFEASVNTNQVSVGERFQIKFELNANGSGFRAPSFSDFQVLSGPNQSTSMQWVNGNMSSSISYSYLLVPTKEGNLTIGSASIQVDGKSYETNPITITVTKGNQQQQQPANNGRQNNSQPKASNDITDNLFIKLYVDKNKVYQGEAIVATYKI